ncbi:MAG TPA: hypothetical protein VMZ91_04465, partial [Candidatus Paceibacterota bacterium]|nr:hypothetical protein [Candidatus Paceibacterota bacterium]
MKKFRKSKKELFICEECEKIFFYKKTLSRHINKYHSIKEYYDKWLKENDEGLCKICKKETKFTGFKRYYKKTCSKKCEDKYRQLRIEEENLIHFGVKNHYQREDVKEKIKQTCI